MTKQELKYSILIGTKKNSIKYQSLLQPENKKMILELAKEGFGYALYICLNGPTGFLENKEEFINVYCKLIEPFYTKLALKYDKDGVPIKPGKTKAEQKNEYEKIIELYNYDELVKEILLKSTDELLIIFKSVHMNAKNNKELSSDIKDKHNNCIKKIKELQKNSEKFFQEAEKFKREYEIKNIQKRFFNKDYDEEIVNKIDEKIQFSSTLNSIFNEEFLEKIIIECKNENWKEFYFEQLADKGTKEQKFKIFNKCIMLYKNLKNDKLLINLFRDFSCEEQYKEVEKIKDQKIFEVLFDCYIKKYSSPQEITALSKIYLERFEDSGFSLYYIVDILSKTRFTSNQIFSIVEEKAKKWLISYNCHQHENEIIYVIKTLNSIDKLDDLFFDMKFWLELESCNAFSLVVEVIAKIIGVDEIFNRIKSNVGAARAFEKNVLVNKWLQAANNIALRNNDAKVNYVFFIRELIGENSVLDSVGKDNCLRETINYLIQEVYNFQKRLDIEKQKIKEQEEKFLKDSIFYLKNPLAKLEKLIIGFSMMDAPVSQKELAYIRKEIGEIRKGLDSLGIKAVAQFDDWVKMREVLFDNKIHQTSSENEDIEKDMPVLYQTLGIQLANGNYLEKAIVRKSVGGNVNGNSE